LLLAPYLQALQGRKYLDYDLEGMRSFIKAADYQHVFIAFEDSEGFDSALVSELILLFRYEL